MNDESEGTRIPEEINRIQVNFCKNPRCPNFGVPASTKEQPRGSKVREGGRDSYTMSGVSGRGYTSSIRCDLCRETLPLKSNQAIVEEIGRLSAYLVETPIMCPNTQCENHTIDIGADKSRYRPYGKTKAGSRRYLCRLCQRAFVIGTPAPRHKKPYKNIPVFRLLVNKMPLKRICEAADISMPTLYDKIDFIHRQCLNFAADHERRLLRDMPIRRLYLAVDRQDYLVNWSQTEDKRNIQLSAAGTADNTTGYVFGLHLNFDPSLDRDAVEFDATEAGDYEKKRHFRKYARLWLPGDYIDAMERGRMRHFASKSLPREIESTYQETDERDDIEVSESLDETIRLPRKGMQVHSEYTLYAHFFFLRQLLSGVEKVRFFLDQESGIRAACLSAFVDEIKQGNCDAFYVRINKDLTIDDRRKALSQSKKEWNALRAKNSGLTDSALKLLIIKERIKAVKTYGKWGDRWVVHPFPNLAEPEKAVCFLTDTENRYDEDHIAWLYNKASLHAIDRFFMQARRRMSLLERPISTPSSLGRRWHGYSPYNPGILIKMLDIFRVFYNFVEAGKDKQTPAMRLGLAKGQAELQDIVYYS
jgi:transposase-like protein